MKRVACYVRVSSAEQKNHGLSVDNQIEALQAYCEEHNYTCAGIYNDAGISARKRYTKRPALLQLMDDCDKGKIDLIIFTKLDRWFRSVADYYEVQSVLDRNKIPWRAIWEDYETETSSGVFKVNIMLSVAQSEADRTSERVKKIIEYKKARGDWISTAPIGYKRVDNHLEIDRDQEPAVRAFFKCYMETFSLNKALEKAHSMGLSFTLTTALKMTDSLVYFGMHEHKCEPYLTKADYDYIQAKSKKVKRRTAKNQVYLFSGLLRCSICDHALRCSNTKQSGKIFNYYKCNGMDSAVKHEARVNISEKCLEDYLIAHLHELIGDHNLKISARNADQDEEAKIKQKKSLEAKLERIGLRFELGDLSAEEYKQKRADIKKEISEISFDGIRKPIQIEENWLDIYNSLDRDHKKIFWNKMIKVIHVSPKSEGQEITVDFNDYLA